jgi:hypothetical protein
MTRHDDTHTSRSDDDQLIVPTEFDAILAERAELLAAARALDEAAATLRELMRGSSAFGRTVYDLVGWPDTRARLGDTNKTSSWPEAFAHKADTAYWEHLLTRSGLERMFGPGELKKFREQLTREHIELTEASALATLRDLASRAPELFAARCHTIVSSIDPEFATNDSFGLGKKFIWSSAMGDVSRRDFGVNYYRREAIWDLDAVFHELDAKAPPARREGLVGALDAHGREHGSARAGVVVTDYFRVKVHKNQNIHVIVLDDALLERFNALVSDHRRLCHRRETRT